MWLLGNENNIATWSKCNARQKIKKYYELVNEIAKMIHQMDPLHPVAICEGYSPFDIRLYRKYLPDIDIVAFNAYLGDAGFGDTWDLTKKYYDRPAFISEYGLFSYNTIDGYSEEQQLDYHKGCFVDLMINKAGGSSPTFGRGAGNCIGGVIFDYIDRWYMDDEPLVQNPGKKYWSFSKDHLDHEEYFGITSMGDGRDNYFKRQLKSTYLFYQKQWNK
jgi:beta-glucuronidase